MLRHALLRNDAANMIPRANRTSVPRASIQTYAVFDKIPRRFFSPFNFANVYRFRKPQRTIVAWHALEAEPSLLPLLILIVLVFAVLLLCRQVPLVLARRAKVWQWLNSLQFQQSHELPSQSSQTSNLHRKYSHAVEKLAKVVQKCQALQLQLKEQNERIYRQHVTLGAALRDLEYLQKQNKQLKADNDTLTTAHDQLKADNATLERHVKEQFDEQERRVKDWERDQDALERAVQFLETEQTSMTVKCEALVVQSHHDNEELKRQLAEQSHALQQERVIQSTALTQLQSRLDASISENESLKQQLQESGNAHSLREMYLEQKLAEVEARHQASLQQLQDQNASLRQQLEDQNSEHRSQKNSWLERISLASADQSEVKAKLERLQRDLELKSAEAARLAAHKTSRTDLRKSFAEDLSFVHLESECARSMYEGQLTTAQTEIKTLREQLDRCVKRYERDAARLARAQAEGADKDRLTSRVKALEAQKKVSDDLENMLSDALRNYEDKYETLEISFDVLESAYSFLAAELVRTEHLLKDSKGVQKQLRRSLHAYEHPDEPLPEEETEEEEEVESILEPQDDEVIDTDVDEDDTRIPTAMSMFSERSWPATPGLSISSMSSITTGFSVRSPLSSPIVMSPLLPSLRLPSKPPTEGFPSAYPSSEPDDVFGGWSIVDEHPRDAT